MNEIEKLEIYPGNSLPEQEEERLRRVCRVSAEYMEYRKEQIGQFKEKIKVLEEERLASNDWNDKNRIAERIRAAMSHLPEKYLLPFEFDQSPYFGLITIEDDDEKIARQTYLIGKQGLSNNNEIVVIDWRTPIGKFFYDYYPGDIYDETISGKERTGELVERTKYGINSQILSHFESSSHGIFRKTATGWQKDGGSVTSTEIKEEAKDHHLPDVLSLITKEQYEIISKRDHGIFSIIAPAGAGKTTVGLYRLSFLQFNFPEQYPPEKTLIIIFNASLKYYISQSAKDNLDKKSNIETFHSFGLKALTSLGVRNINFVETPAIFEPIKNSNEMAALIEEYAETAGDELPLDHLFKAYSNERLCKKHLRPKFSESLLKSFIYHGNKGLSVSRRAIGYSDLAPLLRICQLRRQSKSSGVSAFGINYFTSVMIDEVQDLSMCALKSVLAATTSAKIKNIIIAGDPSQRILKNIDPQALPLFQKFLSQLGMATENLKIGYRSTRQIIEVANAVINVPLPDHGREGVPVQFKKTDSKEMSIEYCKTIIREEFARNKNQLLTIICKFKAEVDFLYKALKKEFPFCRKETRYFSFESGVVIANLHQIKGLESSSVILYGVSSSGYREKNPVSCAELYVAVTRAADRLYMVTHLSPSPLVKRFFSS